MGAETGQVANRVTRPIFKPLRSRFRVFGIPAAKFIAIVLAGVLGVVLATVTGDLRHDVREPYTEDQMEQTYEEYQDTLAQLQEIEAMRVAQGAGSYDDLSLTAPQADVVEEARDAGMSAGMTKPELASIVPTYHVESEPIVPDVVRYVVLAGLPVVVMVVLFMETNHTSALKEARRYMRWASSQKTFKSRPVAYVERETGESYWDAVLGAGETPGKGR